MAVRTRSLVTWLVGVLLGLICVVGQPAWSQQAPLDKSVYILLDTSGSMSSGSRMASAKQAVGVLLDRLEAEGDYDTGLILTNGGNVVVPLGPGNINRIRSIVNGLSPSGGDNPITSLDAFVARVLPGISNRCHMIVVVTDGNDGVNPAASAAQVRSSCSRVFVVGVDLSDVTILRDTAIAGGGRFCNGQESEAIVRCMIGVFKRFAFDEARKACVDDAGISGLNPAPTALAAQRLGDRNFNDWNCIDFTTINPIAGPWSSILFRPSYDYRGSRFARLDLRSKMVAGQLAGADFSGADLSSASISLPPATDGVLLTGANLSGARLLGQGREAGCVRGLDLTGTQADPNVRRTDMSEVKNIHLCEARLPARFAPQTLESVRLSSPRTPAGELSLTSRYMTDLALNQLNLTTLLVSTEDGTGSDASVTLTNVTARTLTFSNRNFKKLTLNGVRANEELKILDGHQSDVVASNLVVNKLTVERLGSMSINVGEIQTMSSRFVTKLTMFAAPIRVGGKFEEITGQISMRGDTTSVNNLRVCTACTFDSRGLLAFEDMTLPNASFSGDFTINAVDTSFKNGRWRASPNPNSAFTRVDISGSRFEGGSSLGYALGFPKANLNARETFFCAECRIQIVDGDDKLDFGQAMIESVIELRNPAMRDLNLAGAKGIALSGQTEVPAGAVRLAVKESRGVSLERLDLTGTNAHVSMLEGPLECRSCRIDKANLSASWTKLTLIGASAREASLNLAGATALTLERGDYSKSRWPGGMISAECDGAVLSGAQIPLIQKSRLYRCKLDGAAIGGALGGFKDVESDGVDFSGAKISRATLEGSSFRGGSFARTQFDEARLIKSTFGSTSFDGAQFKSGFISETTFEGVRFNGPNGPASITEMAGVASTMQGVKFIDTDFSGLNLANWTMQGVELSNVSFARADLSRINWRIMVMNDVRFDGATLDQATLHGKLIGLRFPNAKVNRLSVSGSLASSSLTGVSHDPLTGIFMLPFTMDGVDLRRVDLSTTILEPLGSTARLTALDLDGARVSCSWKSAITAAGPSAARGSFTYTSYQMGPAAFLADGTCDPIMP
ncbi:hypothetical protein PbB2_01607 [Candidatus Phycosocius bacilliformis]|uniref:VWFA domain-containing protein n=1 Tax=Candidatus Phycosocius bacilliformis TaxID=1445552 RepID=A0A2P2EA47_9PROT|nr:pentapeptide repeat-containing protein [Candidatus Phycosocius bacilliformis]GBF57936.1 hypothetical protein PbB2_01607 [Candidatus Phycosocius bacilliformis]